MINYWTMENQNDSKLILRVKPGCNLKVRPICKLIRVLEIYAGYGKYLYLENENSGQLLKDKYPDRLGRPSDRYACWVINRKDGSLRILDMPYYVYRPLFDRELSIDKKIYDSQFGGDWNITTNGKKGKGVRYKTVFVEKAPISEDEMNMIRNKKSEQDDYFDLSKIYDICSFEQADAKLTNSYVAPN